MKRVLTGSTKDKLHFKKLAGAGLARLPKRKFSSDFWRTRGPADPEGRGLTALLEERGSTR